MKTEESLEQPGEENGSIESVGGRGGFAAGLLLGLFLGAGFALLFAPEEGNKTRGRLGKRIRSLRDDARQGLDRAGSRTRKELLRQQRRLRAELRRLRELAKDAKDSLD